MNMWLERWQARMPKREGDPVVLALGCSIEFAEKAFEIDGVEAVAIEDRGLGTEIYIDPEADPEEIVERIVDLAVAIGMGAY